jgi:hypothetical protein
LSHRYCYLPLSWKSWNRFECAVGGVSHPQHTQTCPAHTEDLLLKKIFRKWTYLTDTKFGATVWRCLLTGSHASVAKTKANRNSW